jgi:hypothetical protein
MKNGNKPAYPQKKEFIDVDETGLTKREYFAAMAMQGLLSNSKLWANIERVEDVGMYEWFALQSKQYADELLKQLEL